MGYAHDIGSQVAVVHSYTLALTSAAAGVTTASTASMGEPIDRLAMAGDFQSVKNCVSLFFRAATTATPANTVTIALEDSDTSGSTSFVAYTTATSKIIGCTSGLAATNYYGQHSQDIDLAGAGRWLRQVVTVINTATCSSDTMQAEGYLIFGGCSVAPATT
jgi:hypothetical protein